MYRELQRIPKPNHAQFRKTDSCLSDFRRLTAIHEAGHACVHFALELKGFRAIYIATEAQFSEILSDLPPVTVGNKISNKGHPLNGCPYGHCRGPAKGDQTVALNLVGLD